MLIAHPASVPQGCMSDARSQTTILPSDAAAKADCTPQQTEREYSCKRVMPVSGTSAQQADVRSKCRGLKGISN